MSFRLGIIGCGSIGEVHAIAAVAAGQSIAGFCDIHLEKAQHLAKQCPGAIATTSIDELLAQPDMPAVVVAVPNHLHKSVAIAALHAGKDVLLEKPMGMNIAECDEIISAMQKSNQLIQMGFVTRYSQTSRAAHAFIQAGRLGSIYHVKASVYRRRGIPGLGRWFTTKRESGGGVLIDLGVHQIDLVLHLTGRPKVTRVSASCTSTFGSLLEEYNYTEMWAGPPNLAGVFDVEDAATALLRFETGMTMELNVMWAGNLPAKVLPDGVTLLGDRGGCFFEPTGKRFSLATEEDGYLVDVTPHFPLADPWPLAFQREHELFEDMVANRRQPLASAAHGREVQAIVEAIYRSSKESGEVSLK